MTARGLFEALLTELSKVNAPSMLLEDFNYYINRAVNQYVNKRYNIYDVNQLTSDDIRILKSTTILTPEKADDYSELSEYGAGNAKLFGATYEVNLPLDYLHMLNCICIYRVDERYKCYNSGDYVQFAAKRLTADAWSTIINDYYNRPKPERPYYYIHNVNTSTITPTNPVRDLGSEDGVNVLLYLSQGTDVTVEGGMPVFIQNTDKNVSVIEKEAGRRYGNSQGVRCEIRYGQDDSVFVLDKVLIDYIKAPQFIRLTLEQVNLTKDTSQVLEFPDYVCQEIVKELVTIVMERVADPRLLTFATVSESIANPTPQLTQQPPRRQSLDND